MRKVLIIFLQRSARCFSTFQKLGVLDDLILLPVSWVNIWFITVLCVKLYYDTEYHTGGPTFTY